MSFVAPFSIPGDSSFESKDLTWNSSANILCKYMSRATYLQEIIKHMAIIPRYVEEIVDYLGVDNFYSYAIPMICFCDIPLSKVQKHSDAYGKYGIALNKQSILKKVDIQPIMYVNSESAYHSDLSEAFQQLIPHRGHIPEDWAYLADFLVMQLTYVKPIRGKMPTRSGMKERLFQDECEWRYVPVLPDDMDSFILNPPHDEEKLKYYNKALRLTENRYTWLHFSIDDICYLIVPNEKAANNLTDFISKDMKGTLREDEIFKLVRKIEISDYFGKNYV